VFQSAAENLRIPKFRAYTGRVCIYFIAYWAIHAISSTWLWVRPLCFSDLHL